LQVIIYDYPVASIFNPVNPKKCNNADLLDERTKILILSNIFHSVCKSFIYGLMGIGAE